MAEPDPVPVPLFAVGERVEKIKGYHMTGEVRAVFTTRAGLVHYVVDFDLQPAVVFIYRPEQLRLLPPEDEG